MGQQKATIPTMMAFSLSIMLSCMLSPSLSHAQTPIGWQALGQVAFVPARDPIDGYSYTKPVFPPSLQDLADQLVSVIGYVLPADADGTQYVLSAFPYASCFFCGGAGRESVIMLDLQPGHRRFVQDEYVRFEGILRLVEAEYDLIYRLEEARLVE